MDGFIKKSLSRMLLSLFLIASITQNLSAMGGQPQITTITVTTGTIQPNAQANTIVQAPVNRGKFATAIFAAKDGLCWAVKFPFKKISSISINLLKTAKGLGFLALNAAELATYLYILDYILILAAPCISAHMPLSSWPIVLQDVVTQIATYYKPGEFISLISTIINTHYSPTKSLCPTQPKCIGFNWPYHVFTDYPPAASLCPAQPTCIGITW